MNGIGAGHLWLRFLPRFVREKIENRHNLQKILDNVGWLFADKIIRMGVGLFVGAWVARYLGPTQFGTYNYAIAFVALFAPFATIGLDKIVVRNILRNPSMIDETLGTAFVLKLIAGLFTSCLAVGLVFLIRPTDNLTRWLVGITGLGLIFQAFDTIDYWFQSQVQSQYIVYARNAAFLIVALVKIIMIVWSAPLIAFAWAGLAEIMLAAIGLVVLYRMNRQNLRAWSVNFNQARMLLTDAWPLILSGLSIVIYMKIDQVMLGEMIGSRTVGIYSAVTKISEIWYFIPVAIVSSVFPSIIKIKSEDENIYYSRLQKLFSFMTVLACGISIVMTFLSTKVVALIFGSGFAQGGPILAVHIWASIFVFLGVAQGPWDLAENLTKLSLWRTSAGAIINVALNFILIPKYQAMGAAVATVISYACSGYLLNAFHSKTRTIFIKQTKSLFFIHSLWSSR
jgi:PST family polysaccharide transporter